MKLAVIFGIALAVVIALYLTVLWLDYYGRETTEAAAERTRAVELANAMCRKHDWKLAGNGKDLVITCVPRVAIGEGRKP